MHSAMSNERLKAILEELSDIHWDVLVLVETWREPVKEVLVPIWTQILWEWWLQAAMRSRLLVAQAPCAAQLHANKHEACISNAEARIIEAAGIRCVRA